MGIQEHWGTGSRFKAVDFGNVRQRVWTWECALTPSANTSNQLYLASQRIQWFGLLIILSTEGIRSGKLWKSLYKTKMNCCKGKFVFWNQNEGNPLTRSPFSFRRPKHTQYRFPISSSSKWATETENIKCYKIIIKNTLMTMSIN